jgi:hypothetical protein
LPAIINFLVAKDDQGTEMRPLNVEWTAHVEEVTDKVVKIKVDSGGLFYGVSKKKWQDSGWVKVVLLGKQNATAETPH